MAHVQFRAGSAVDGESPVSGNMAAQLIVDGVDITNHVLAEGFSIGESNGDPLAREWVVRLTLAAESIDVDLPDAVLEVTREGKAS